MKKCELCKRTLKGTQADYKYHMKVFHNIKSVQIFDANAGKIHQKKPLMKLFIPGLLIIALCVPSVHAKKKPKYEYILGTYIGHSIEIVVKELGYPQSDLIAPNGNKVYVWQSAQERNLPTWTSPQMSSWYGQTGFNYGGITAGGGSVTAYCNTYFEVNTENVITGASWQGNACPK